MGDGEVLSCFALAFLSSRGNSQRCGPPWSLLSMISSWGCKNFVHLTEQVSYLLTQPIAWNNQPLLKLCPTCFLDPRCMEKLMIHQYLALTDNTGVSLRLEKKYEDTRYFHFIFYIFPSENVSTTTWFFFFSSVYRQDALFDMYSALEQL